MVKAALGGRFLVAFCFAKRASLRTIRLEALLRKPSSAIVRGVTPPQMGPSDAVRARAFLQRRRRNQFARAALALCVSYRPRKRTCLCPRTAGARLFAQGTSRWAWCVAKNFALACNEGARGPRSRHFNSSGHNPEQFFVIPCWRTGLAEPIHFVTC